KGGANTDGVGGTGYTQRDSFSHQNQAGAMSLLNRIDSHGQGHGYFVGIALGMEQRRYKSSGFRHHNSPCFGSRLEFIECGNGIGRVHHGWTTAHIDRNPQGFMYFFQTGSHLRQGLAMKAYAALAMGGYANCQG